MKLEGVIPLRPFSERILGYVVTVLVLTVILTPWLLISVGCIFVGCLAWARDEPGLLVCLPAGVSLLIAFPLLFWLQRVWYPPICSFAFDGTQLQFAFDELGKFETRLVSEIATVYKAKKPKRRRVRGYIVTFRDRKSIFVSRALNNADSLYAALIKATCDR